MQYFKFILVVNWGQFTTIFILVGLFSCGQQMDRQLKNENLIDTNSIVYPPSLPTNTFENINVLEFLNNYPDNPFFTERDVNGLCFITLSDSFDYYAKPIVFKNIVQKEILKIEFNGSEFVTTFKEKKYSGYDTSNTFNPWRWINNKDYFQLVFECIDTSGSYYKVLLNDKVFALINKDNLDFKKQSIYDFVKEWTSMGLDFNREENPLKESPDDNSPIIKHPDQNKYKIWRGESLEIKDNWIKVKTVADEIGWVKWRQENKVLIRMYFTC